MAKPSVFICHASADKPFARKLYADLRKFGISVWLDEKEIAVGDSIYDSVEHGLSSSDYTIVVLSQVALERPWVKKEIAASFNVEVEKDQKRILPILIEDCPLPVFLRDKRYADFRHSYDDALADLLRVFGIGDSGPRTTDLWAKSSIVELDIVAANGSLVKYEKHTTAVCMREGLDEIVELWTADGKMSDFETNIGSITDVTVESGVTYVHIHLPRRLQKGERIDRVFRMKLLDSFLSDSEYWEGKQFAASDSYKLIVRFPSARPPQRWDVYERDAIKTSPSKWKAALIQEHDRPTLQLEVVNPELYRNYVLRWWW